MVGGDFIVANDSRAAGGKVVFGAKITDQRCGLAVLGVGWRESIEMLYRAVAARIVGTANLYRDMLNPD